MPKQIYPGQTGLPIFRLEECLDTDGKKDENGGRVRLLRLGHIESDNGEGYNTGSLGDVGELPNDYDGKGV